MTTALPLAGLVGRFGYPAIAGMVFVEGFGIPAPGEAAIIVGGVYAGGARLQIGLVAAVAFVAAVAGDNVGYLLGRLLGRSAVLRFGRFVFLTPDRFDRLARFMGRRGGAVVAGARFVEGLRQLNGVVAGVTGMPWRRFVLFNAVGAGAWVGVWVTAGYLAGDHVTAILAAVGHYQWYVVVAAVAGVAGHVLLRRAVRRRGGHRPTVGASLPADAHRGDDV